MNLTEEQKMFLRDNSTDAEEMMNANTVNAILLPLDALITYRSFDENYELNAWVGETSQRMCDHIYMQNEK